jgi:hypothetical protein
MKERSITGINRGPHAAVRAVCNRAAVSAISVCRKDLLPADRPGLSSLANIGALTTKARAPACDGGIYAAAS